MTNEECAMNMRSYGLTLGPLRRAGATFIGLLLVGCTSMYPPIGVRSLPTEASVVHYDASRRGAYVVWEDEHIRSSRVMICAEPAPETALKFLAEGNLRLAQAIAPVAAGITPGQPMSLSLGGSLTTDVVRLVEHTQLTLFAREALYRLCELQLNRDGLKTGISSTELTSLYRKTLETVIALASAPNTAQQDAASHKKSALEHVHREADNVVEIKGQRQAAVNQALRLSNSKGAPVFADEAILVSTATALTTKDACKEAASQDDTATCDRALRNLRTYERDLRSARANCKALKEAYINEFCSGNAASCGQPAPPASCD